MKLSPVGKSGAIGPVDLCHLLDGKGKRVSHGGDVIDLVEREVPFPARLQVLVEHLIAADVKILYGLRHRFEALLLVDPNRLVFGVITHSLDFVLALALIFGQALARQLPQEMRLDESPA